MPIHGTICAHIRSYICPYKEIIRTINKSSNEGYDKSDDDGSHDHPKLLPIGVIICLGPLGTLREMPGGNMDL